MKKNTITTLFASISIFALGCSNFNDNPTSSASKGKIISPFLYIPSSLESGEFDGRMLLYSIQEYDNTRGGLITDNQANAQFYKDTIIDAVDAGALTINSTTIQKHVMPAGSGGNSDSSTVYDTYNFPGVNFNGTTYSFVTTGSSYFPACSIAVQSPTARPVITTPSKYDTISKSSNYTVTWSGTTDTANGVIIMIQGDNYYHEKLIDDTGSYTIPSSVLSNYNNGYINIIIARGHIGFQEISTNTYACASVVAAYKVKCNLSN